MDVGSFLGFKLWNVAQVHNVLVWFPLQAFQNLVAREIGSMEMHDSANVNRVHQVLAYLLGIQVISGLGDLFHFVIDASIGDVHPSHTIPDVFIQ